LNSRKWFPALLLLAILATPAAGAEEPVILFPPDLTLSVEESMKIFVYSPGEKTPLPVAVNGIAREPLKGESFQSGQATLYPGVNILNVGGNRVKVYHLPGAKTGQFRLPGDKEKPPMVFQSYRLHPALDDGCEGCHLLEGGKLKAKGQKEACYACHDNFEKEEEGKKKYLHTPVKAGECTGCHDPHFSIRPKLQKLEKGCFECHDPFSAEGTVHYPVAKRECTPCHSSHAGPGPNQVVLAGNALCLKCHENTHTKHRSAEIRKPATTQIPPDVPRDKENISCVACHLPHRSAERRLFRKSQGELCRTCHLI
jgi:predicted CXXCH cytochrome family protein